MNLTIQIYGRAKTLGYKTTPEYKERKRLKRKDECPYCDGMKSKTADGCWDCKTNILRLHQQLELDKEKWQGLLRGAKVTDKPRRGL